MYNSCGAKGVCRYWEISWLKTGRGSSSQLWPTALVFKAHSSGTMIDHVHLSRRTLGFFCCCFSFVVFLFLFYPMLCSGRLDLTRTGKKSSRDPCVESLASYFNCTPWVLLHSWLCLFWVKRICKSSYIYTRSIHHLYFCAIYITKWGSSPGKGNRFYTEFIEKKREK